MLAVPVEEAWDRAHKDAVNDAAARRRATSRNRSARGSPVQHSGSLTPGN